ncbi:MAG TPA: ADP-ribosylglycohydrolase family protein [Acidimicrobiales bacterium]|jgi:ADP-ribosylglycohydrolase|nr:ADP-ribosylglycohydrolase family protein [Acidimicrobiales bacterium]
MRIQAARDALDGLSVGDALGEQFCGPPDEMRAAALARRARPAPWRWTDDTLMASSVFEVLAAGREDDQDAYARSFAERYEPGRGHGPATRDLLSAIGSGGDWRTLAPAAFGGRGSWGNGAAMRVGPLGAFHAGDPAGAARAAARQAVVTHTHAEAVDGAVAVAVAASVGAASRGGTAPGFAEVLGASLERLGETRTAAGLRQALRLGPGTDPATAGAVLGTGAGVAAFDTVPFALWSAACSPDDYEETFWRTVVVLGDRDTTCAIAGAVVGARVGPSGIPQAWLAAREPLPPWVGAGSRPGSAVSR